MKNKLMNCLINKMVKNIPNILTFSRIIASILAAGSFVTGNIMVAFLLYVYGGVSDFLDGIAARKLNAFSEFGRKLDTISDKLYAGSLLIPGILCGNLLMLIPLILELRIAYINLKGQKAGFKPETQRVGKIKTAALFPTIIVGLLATISPELYLLLWPLMVVSTNLQLNSITVYKNLYNYSVSKSKIVKNEKVSDVVDINEEVVSNQRVNINIFGIKLKIWRMNVVSMLCTEFPIKTIRFKDQ